MIADDIENYLAALELEEGSAKNTYESYGRDLRLFRRFLAERGKVNSAEVELNDIVEFLESEREEGKKATTRARRAAAIRMFFKHLFLSKQLQKNPAELLETFKRGEALPRVLSEEEVTRIIESVNKDDARDLRDRAMLEILYGCGMRVSELCNFKMEDIIGDGELVRIYGKGAKERVVPLGAQAAKALLNYYYGARESFTQGNLGETHVFVTRLGHKFTRQGVFKIIKERALAANIPPERISPHVFRHSYASHMLEHGADIRAIQELLGHADIGTTQIYTHVDHKRFKELHKKHHPRG